MDENIYRNSKIYTNNKLVWRKRLPPKKHQNVTTGLFCPYCFEPGHPLPQKPNYKFHIHTHRSNQIQIPNPSNQFRSSAMADQPLLPSTNNKNKQFSRTTSSAYDELHTFRSCLRWMCVDQSSIPRAIFSWSVFLLFTIVVPALSHFLLACSDCDAKHRKPYDGVVQLSLSSVATLSFLCLSRFVMKYGLKRFLFFDKLCHESQTVATGYTQQLSVSPFSSSSFKFQKLRALDCTYMKIRSHFR